MCEYECGCGRKVLRPGHAAPPPDGLCEECRYVGGFPASLTDQANDHAVRRLLELIDEGAAVRPGIEGGQTS